MVSIINKKKISPRNDPSRPRRGFSGRWLFYLILLLFLGTVVYAFFFSDFLKVDSVGIDGLDKLEDGPIRASIDEHLSGKYLGLANRNNLLLFPSGQAARELEDRFHRIKTVRIVKQFPGRITVTIEERKLSLLLCSNEHCYVLDDRGIAYDQDYFAAEDLAKDDLATLDDSSGAQVAAGTQPLEDGFQDFILNLNGRFANETGIPIRKDFETPSQMSGDVTAETEEGWRIYFSDDISLDKEIMTFKAVLRSRIEPGRTKDLEYVDLRINNKVYYRFKDGTEQVTDEAVPETPPPVNGNDNKKKEDKKK